MHSERHKARKKEKNKGNKTERIKPKAIRRRDNSK